MSRRDQSPATGRDHGGGVDAAVATYGGARAQWVDLSTGINPVPYPLGDIPTLSWTSLPDRTAQQALITAARTYWNIPQAAAVLAAPGASSLIARIPALRPAAQVHIPSPTYNEHAAAFEIAGWQVLTDAKASALARVIVHPNNPTGQWHHDEPSGLDLHIIDESFADVAPERSLVSRSVDPGTVILKSFGKFWGLAGVRLGFAIGDHGDIAALANMLGPWPVAGPALEIATHALQDPAWSIATRLRLDDDAARLDGLMIKAGATLSGGTSLFRLYHVDSAADWQHRLAQAHIWSRIFPYSKNFLRLGLPAPNQWAQLESAL